MRCLLSVLQEVDVFVDWYTTVEGGASDLLQVFCKSVKFLLDLVGEFSSIAQDEGSSWLWIILVDLVEDRQDEHSGLTHTRDSLAEDILT